jgi:hypothetical protein
MQHAIKAFSSHGLGIEESNYKMTKIKHVAHLQALLKNTASDGFYKKDLGTHIFTSDSMYGMIFPTQSKPLSPYWNPCWNPCFKWQVDKIPVYNYTGEGVVDDTVLAIAKDSEFCAVITISLDLERIWYRMYKNDADIPGIFGSLMCAYTQTEDPSESKYYSSIFTLFDPDQTDLAEENRWREVHIEFKHYIHDYNESTDTHNYDLHTYIASAEHNQNGGLDPVYFEDDNSEGAFEYPDPCYHHLLQTVAIQDDDYWTIDPRLLIQDCMFRPTQQTRWKLTSDALVTEITRSVIRALAM